MATFDRGGIIPENMERFPRVHVFLAKDDDPPTRHLGQWRLYLRAAPWPLFLRQYANADLEVFPVDPPNLDDLDSMMWDLDAPYRKRVTERGDVELEASGFAAICLSEWLQQMFLPVWRGRVSDEK